MGKIKVASFFSGVGGFDLGFERIGMEIVFQCEINNFCKKVLKKHWPNTKLCSNINDLDAFDIPDADLWCGGFPCQDLSLANQGKRKGLGGERSGLFFKFAEFISKKKPRWVIIENVPGILNSAQGKDFKVIIKALDKLGYGISWRVLDAKYFGVPQRRRRIYIVCSFGNLLSAEVLFGQKSTSIAPRQGFSTGKINAQKAKNSNKESNIYIIQHAAIGRKHTAGPQAKGYRNDGETYTLDSRGNADAACKTTDTFRMRKTTGLSKGLDGNRYRAIGNAVAIPVIEWIGRRIQFIEEGISNNLLIESAIQQILPREAQIYPETFSDEVALGLSRPVQKLNSL